MAKDNPVNKSDIFNIFTGLPAFANAKNNFSSTDASRVGQVYRTQIPALTINNFNADENKVRSDQVLAFLDLLTNTYSQLRYYRICKSGGGCYYRTGYRSGFSGNDLLTSGERSPFGVGQVQEFAKYNNVLPQIQAKINTNASKGGGTLTYCHSSCHSSCHCSRGRR